MILLDTCALLWLNTDRSQFSRRAMRSIEQFQDGLALSPVSILEISIKLKKEKLQLPLPLRDWAQGMRDNYGLKLIPLSQDIALTVHELPDIHSDPFDRIIIATAMAHRLGVVTADKHFSRYPGLRVIW